MTAPLPVLTVILAIGLIAAPLPATAQPTAALRQGLRDLGLVEGRNLILDVRGAEGHPDRLPALVAELMAGKPDIVVAVAPQPARAAKDAAGTIPVVFVAVADPVASGLVSSLARPGGNVTGLSMLVPGGFMGKNLQLS